MPRRRSLPRAVLIKRAFPYSMEFLPGRRRILARLELALTSLPLDGHLNGRLNERTR